MWLSPVSPQMFFFWSRTPHCIWSSYSLLIFSLIFHHLMVLRSPDQIFFAGNPAFLLPFSPSHFIPNHTNLPSLRNRVWLVVLTGSTDSVSPGTPCHFCPELMLRHPGGCQRPNSHSDQIFSGETARSSPR